MNTGFGIAQVSLRFVIESSDHSVSNHLPSSRRASGVALRRAYRTTLPWPPFLGAVRQLGFTIP